MWLKLLVGTVFLGLLSGVGWAGEEKPLSEIIRSAEIQGYAPVEVERENGLWEIEATKGGKTYELAADPKTGEIRSVEEENEEEDSDENDETAETVAAEDSAETPETPLRQLQWLVGTWVDEGADATIRTTCHWTRHRYFLARTFSVESEGKKVLEGTQVIGWDPVSQQIRSWMFDSEGGVGLGTWTQDGDHWNVKTSYSLATGERASAINVLTPVGENTIRWKSINREIEGEIQPNIPEVTVVREADN